ncbi:isocitrate/isopropylmalate dehydrogenase family protein [Clostridium sp. AM58-1XD]|uniref:isocitrate/isopropylmalate dehydrogenase family protein n=1 Tax=Clostridium sp. AM58-1XD TaxID=2292307 RepID=UPI000E551B8B|nr:isocitrate/isopropylmalate dehydrogenase family protein [Clostridium sp. AM58-1XD]RGZ00392.1 isocitrate/isopropylmalate dehydrogenase family protein [Clostridium sp. AM58-1XD]
MKIGVLKGNGIGPEIVQATLHVIDACGLDIEWMNIPIAEEAIEKYGHPVPSESIQMLKDVKIAIKGPITVEKGKGRVTCIHEDESEHIYPSFNNAIRRELELFVCQRPSRGIPNISGTHEHMDVIIMRELTEGVYSAIEHRIDNVAAECTNLVTRKATERLAHYSFQYARKNNRKKVTCVHKANAISITDGFFLECFRDVAAQYPDIESDDYFVDATTYYLLKKPEMFDVIVTTNQYGDILSDLCAGLSGSLGLGAGANIGHDKAVFEAAHGSAPDIAGLGIANPTSLILSGAMMLRHIGAPRQADLIENSVRTVLSEGRILTRDLGGTASTMEFAEAVAKLVKKNNAG